MIHTYVDLSTCHVKPGTMSKLESCNSQMYGWPAMTIANYDMGIFMTVPYDAEPEQRDALPRDLLAVLDYARKLGASLVRLDSDGDATHKLPVYDW